MWPNEMANNDKPTKTKTQGAYPVALGDAVTAFGIGSKVRRDEREGGVVVAHREAHHAFLFGGRGERVRDII